MLWALYLLLKPLKLWPQHVSTTIKGWPTLKFVVNGTHSSLNIFNASINDGTTKIQGWKSQSTARRPDRKPRKLLHAPLGVSRNVDPEDKLQIYQQTLHLQWLLRFNPLTSSQNDTYT
tara:strand:+ start:892 stop:1245 length:354 start_codon:yes stop_codon:yes gene_type:complete